MQVCFVDVMPGWIHAVRGVPVSVPVDESYRSSDGQDAKQKELQKAALMNSLFNMATDKKGEGRVLVEPLKIPSLPMLLKMG